MNIVLFAALFFVVFFAQPLFACPMCSDIVGRGKDAVAALRFGSGISWSIALMLSVPYLMLGSFIWIIVRAAKRNKKSKEELTGGIKR